MDPNKHNIKFLNQIYIINNLHNKNLYIDYQFALLRLARKQSNLSLASSLLIDQIKYLNHILNIPTVEDSPQYNESGFYDYINNFMIQSSNKTEANINTRILIAKCEIESAKLLLNRNDNIMSIEIITKSISKYFEEIFYLIKNRNVMMLESGLDPLTTAIQPLYPYSSPFYESANKPYMVSINTNLKQNNITNAELNEKYARSILGLTKWLIKSPSVLDEVNVLYLNQKLKKNSDFISTSSEKIEDITNNLIKILNFKNYYDPNIFDGKFSLNHGNCISIFIK